jgi:transposase
MTLDESIQALRRRVIQRAQVLGNVSQACREAGISRTVFYRWCQRFEQYGPDGLHPRRRRARPGRPSRLAPTTERLILASALAWPTWGCARHAAQLALVSLDTFYIGQLNVSGNPIIPGCRN